MYKTVTINIKKQIKKKNWKKKRRRGEEWKYRKRKRERGNRAGKKLPPKKIEQGEKWRWGESEQGKKPEPRKIEKGEKPTGKIRYTQESHHYAHTGEPPNHPQESE